MQVLLTLLYLLRFPRLFSIDKLDCALGRVDEKFCPQDGGWSHWSTWGECEGECGALGRHTRIRNCSNPVPKRNGADCDGEWLQIKPCSVPGCSYEQYEKLLAQDDVRLEQLSNLRKYSGSQSALLTKCLSSSCEMSDVEKTLASESIKFWNSLVCVKTNTGCPVAGGWGDWSPWTRCNARCGPGQQIRCRACCDPPPSTHDVTCQGDSCEYQSCTGVQCGTPLSKASEWSEWSSWSECSAQCNFGYKRRTRECLKEQKTLSNEKETAFNEMYDYDNSGEYANADDYYNYYNNNDREESEDAYEDNNNNPNNIHLRVKRSKSCDKVEYYNNDNNEDDLTETTSKDKRTSGEEYKNKGGKLKSVENPTTVSALEQDSWIFKQTEDQRPVTKLKTESSKLHSIPLSTFSSETFETQTQSRSTSRNHPKTLTHSFRSKELLNDIRVNVMTKLKSSITTESTSDENVDSFGSNESKNLPSKMSKLTTKCTGILGIKKKESKRTDPILLDSEESQCGELYKNSITVSTCEKKEKTYTVDDKEYTNTLTVPYIPQTKTKSNVIYSKTSSDVNSTVIPPFSTSTMMHLNSFKITSKSDKDTNKLKTSEVTVVDLELNSTVGFEYTTGSIQTTTSFSESSKKQDVSSKDGTISKNTGNLNTTGNTEPVKKLFGIFPKKVSTLTVTQASTKYTQTTSQYPESEEVSEASSEVELNISEFSPLSCDLSKKLQLPNFSDLFIAEGCSGPFEEIKPCNTQLCNEDGGWSEWSSWSACVPNCGIGWQISVRSCTNPEPQSNVSRCEGETRRRQSCFLQPCPVPLRTSEAVFMTGESVVKYEATQQLSSVLVLYVRLRHFSPTGNIVSRQPHDCVDKNCDYVTLSLYQSHVLFTVQQRNCHADFLTSQRLSVGDWHEVLLTVVGDVVTLRLDNSVLAPTFNLSCRPSSPNYDADMTLGGAGFVGEVDQLIVNFKNYNFQKRRNKRDLRTQNDGGISPSESSQIQNEVKSKGSQSPSFDLAHLLQAPCFLNASSWNVDLAIKPNLPDGLVLFIKGYDSRDFLFVSLEHTRIRLRIRAAAQAGECEVAETVAPLTWLHLKLSKQAGGPVGLSVNGGHHCIVSLAPATAEEPDIYCTGDILLGNMPLGVKAVLTSEMGHVEPLHSPLGLLGQLSVDNHIRDLGHLPHKTAPGLSTQHQDQEYHLSSNTAASTYYYEEMIVLEGESLSMPCLYDVSSGNQTDANSIQDLEYNWYRLDTPVKTVFANESGIHYEISATGKAVTLTITGYSTPGSVEGFYSCWLNYPPPLPKLNLVTYGVIIVSTTGKRSWLYRLMNTHLCFVIIILIILVIWIVYEGFEDYKKGSGFYRCKKLQGDEAYRAMELFIFSNKAINRLGGEEAAEEALERYVEYLNQKTLAEEEETASETDVTTDNQESHYSTSEEEQGTRRSNKDRNISFQNENTYPKGKGQIVVGRAEVEFKSPFIHHEKYIPRWDSIDKLLISDTEEERSMKMLNSNDNLIDVSDRWKQKGFNSKVKTNNK